MALKKPDAVIQQQQAAQEYEFLLAVSLALRSNQVGQWTSDHTQEAKAFAGANYLAIMAIGRQAARAIGSVYNTGERKAVTLRKSLIGKWGSLWKSFADQGAADTVDSEENWIAALVNKPNPTQSAALFQWEFSQQLHLHGGCLIFNRPTRDGSRVAQRYIIPMALTQPVEPGYFQSSPNGGVRILPYAAGLGFFIHPMIRMLTGCVIPAEYLSFPRYPHPVSRGDGKSPSDAAGAWIDTAQMIDVARWRQLKRGPRPHGIVSVTGNEVTDQQLDDVEKRLNRKLAEEEYDQRVIAVGADIAVNDDSTPAEMDYVNSFDQMLGATLAVHGVSKAAVGLTENQTYGANAASFQQTASMVQSDMDILAGDYTQLAEDHGEKVEVIYEVPPYDDPTLTEEQLQTDLQAGIRTGREWRAMRGLPPYGDWRDDARVTAQGFVLDTTPPGATKPQIPTSFSTEPPAEAAVEDPSQGTMPNSLAKAYRKPGFVMSQTPIIAVDLDGTLAQEIPGAFDPYVIGPPNEIVIAQVREMAAAGCRIVVFTCRDNDDIVAAWLDQCGVPWDAINASPEGFEGSGKVFAHAYLDNRGFNVNDGADAVMMSLPDCDAKRAYFDKYPGALAEAIVNAPDDEPAESEEEPAHKFGCIMLELPTSVCDAIRAEQDCIDPMSLTDDGFCERPHVTLLYGITGMTLAEVVSVVRRLDEMELSFGYCSSFENPNSSVLKIEVESASLREAHQKLKDCLPNVQTWPDYNPHATIAHLLPGCAECCDLSRECSLTGKVTRATHAIVSVDGQEARVPLRRSASSLHIAAPSNMTFDGPSIRREAMALAKSAAIMSMDMPVPAGVVASGIAVVAKDTGRFLMQQRAYDETKEDPAAGMWEFPGGHIERGESALKAAIREWQEETGQKLPEDVKPLSHWQSDLYIGYVIPVECESDIAINGHRRIANPDDPDGDLVEVAAWWGDPAILESDVVREELRADCDRVRIALSKVQAMAKAICKDMAKAMPIVSPSDMQLPTKDEPMAKSEGVRIATVDQLRELSQKALDELGMTLDEYSAWIKSKNESADGPKPLEQEALEEAIEAAEGHVETIAPEIIEEAEEAAQQSGAEESLVELVDAVEEQLEATEEASETPEQEAAEEATEQTDCESFRVQNTEGETGTCRSYYDHFEIDWDSGRQERTLDLSDIGVSKVPEDEPAEQPIDYTQRLEALEQRRAPEGIEDPAAMDAAVQATIETAQRETIGANMEGTKEPSETLDAIAEVFRESASPTEPTEAQPEATEADETTESQPSFPVSAMPIMEATEAARQSDAWFQAFELQEVGAEQLTQAQGAIEDGDPVVVAFGEDRIVISGTAQAVEQAALGVVLANVVDLNKEANQGLIDWKALGL